MGFFLKHGFSKFIQVVVTPYVPCCVPYIMYYKSHCDLFKYNFILICVKIFIEGQVLILKCRDCQKKGRPELMQRASYRGRGVGKTVNRHVRAHGYVGVRAAHAGPQKDRSAAWEVSSQNGEEFVGVGRQ